MQLKQMLVKPSDKQLSYNISYADLTRPLAGPANPFKPASQVSQKKNVLTGYAEPQEFSESAFREQNRTFQALGYARNPSLHTAGGPEFIGDVAKAAEMDGQSILEVASKKKDSAAFEKIDKQKETQVFWMEKMRIKDHGHHTMSIRRLHLNLRNYFRERNMRKIRFSQRSMNLKLLTIRRTRKVSSMGLRNTITWDGVGLCMFLRIWMSICSQSLARRNVSFPRS